MLEGTYVKKIQIFAFEIILRVFLTVNHLQLETIFSGTSITGVPYIFVYFNQVTKLCAKSVSCIFVNAISYFGCNFEITPPNFLTCLSANLMRALEFINSCI